eukprot:3308680-Amphidinium_carterae.1
MGARLHSEQVQRALDEVIQTSLCTTIVIAHRLSTVRAASQVIVIANGVVQEELDNTWRHEPRNVFPIHKEGHPSMLAEQSNGLFAQMLSGKLRAHANHAP